ncbi:DegT/DnrJ/EryC1/StrS family aminotransferase, partial [Pelagibacteraceae bacterium]|nr:DegT/DnrJ/EryC1/StrS family aminotransferase [Pelagibacteraceae bacterium]
MKTKKIIPVNTPLINKSDAREVYKVVKSGWVSSAGIKILEFEKKLSKFVNRKFSCCVSSGTAALEIAVKSLNIKKGSEVITPAFSIISNTNAIIKNNLKPILVDSDLSTWNINILDLEKKINKKTKALMIPHIYGFVNDMDKIIKICKKNNLLLIEDAAEMIGQNYKNKPCGSFGDISVFSFYANKHITTGEGGAIFTNNRIIYEKCKNLRNLNFGKNNRFNHEELGWNYRFTNMQAALGLNQLKRIDKIVRKKRSIGKFFYNNLKKNKNIIIQKPSLSYCKNIYWIFGILLKNSNKKKTQKIRKKLLTMGVDTRDFFWPMNKQNIYIKMGMFKGQKYPVAEFLANNGFYIPSGLGLKKTEMIKICKCLN